MPPADLIQVSPHCYYIPGPTNVSLVHLEGDEVCLIDSGGDKSAARHIRRLLTERGWKLRAIYCTHSHADHIGGCKQLQSQTGCRVYAPGVECAFTRHTLLEPSFLYGGFPPAQLQNKFLMAAPCEALPLTQDALPPGFSLIPLPGHFFDMVGIRTPEDVVFLADAVLSHATLEKYRISFNFDIAAHLRTLDMLPTLPATLFIPAHAEPTADIAPLARCNAEQIHAIAELITSLCRTPLSTEQLLQKIFDALHITMSFEQHFLIGSTLRSYLTWLTDTARLSPTIRQNMLLWQQS